MSKKILCILSIVLFFEMIFSGSIAGYDPGKTKEMISETVENISQNLVIYDRALNCYYRGLDLFDQYIEGDISWSKLADELSPVQQSLSEYNGIKADSALKEFTVQEMMEELYVGELVDLIIQEEMLSDFKSLSDLMDAGISKSELLKFVNLCREIQKINAEQIWYATNEYLIELKDEVTPLIECAANSQNFSELSKNWSHDLDQVLQQEELRNTQMETIYKEKNLLLGNKRMQYQEIKNEAEQTHEQYVNYIMERDSVPRDLAELIAEEEVSERELAAAQQSLREKFAPSVENDCGLLFGKAQKFAGAGMYEEALECIDIYLAKDDDPEYPKICGQALQVLYSNAAETEDIYGLVVLVVSDGSEYYQSGDIIIAINSTPIYGEQEYMETSNLREGEFDAVVLRLNGIGELEKTKITVPAGSAPHFTGREVKEIH